MAIEISELTFLGTRILLTLLNYDNLWCHIHDLIRIYSILFCYISPMMISLSVAPLIIPSL